MPQFPTAAYAKAVKRRSKLSGAHLAEFERALAWAALPTTSDWAQMGTEAQSGEKESTRAAADLA
jgi:hypothetical protein